MDGQTPISHQIHSLPGSVYRGVHVYRPESAETLPILLYFQGGGFIFRYASDNDALCRILASACGCVVISPDYRLAPQNPFPAAPADCYETLEWTVANAAAFHGDPVRIAVAGDSAGGTLAAVVALMNREKSGPHLVSQVLVYPFVGGLSETPSRKKFGPIPVITDAWRKYVANPEDAAHPWATPMNASDLRGLPPAVVIVGEKDPLRDEGAQYAVKLHAAGNDAKLVKVSGAPHGFLTSENTVVARDAAIEIIADELRAKFG